MSERALSSTVKTLLAANIVRPVLFIYADFPSGARYHWTGLGDISFRNRTWNGVGNILDFGSFSETIDSGVQGLEIKVSGADDDLLSDILDDDYQGKDVIIYLAFWNAVKDTLYEADDPLWLGVMDTDSIEDDPEKPIITISLEHRLVDILKSREIRYTDKDQEFLYGEITNYAPLVELHTARWYHAAYPGRSSPTVGQDFTSVGSGISLGSGEGRLGDINKATGSGLLYADSDTWNQVQSTGLGICILVRIDDLTQGGTLISKWSADTSERQWRVYWDASLQAFAFTVSSDGTYTEDTTAKVVYAPFVPRGDNWCILQCWWDPDNEEIGIQVNNNSPVTAAWANGILLTGTSPLSFFGIRDSNSANFNYIEAAMDDIIMFDEPGQSDSIVRRWLWNRGFMRGTNEMNAAEEITVRDTGLTRIEQIQDTSIPWGRTQS